MYKRPGLKGQLHQKQRILLKRLPLYFTFSLFIATLWFAYLFIARVNEGNASTVNADSLQINSIELYINPKVSTQNLNEDLFPVFVSFTHEDLRLVDLGGKVRNQNGKDIQFLSSDGNPLIFEIERYEPFTGRIKAWIHVNREMLLQEKILIKYGIENAPSSITDGFGYPYFAVWHLNGGFQSSAAYPLAGEYRMIKDGEGKICGAKEFLASNMASISFDRPISFPKSGSIQVSAWVKTNGAGETQYIYTDRNKKGGCGLLIDKSSRPVFELYDKNKKQEINSNSSLKSDTWYRITAGYDANNKEAYLYLNDHLEQSIPTKWNYLEGGRPVIGADYARCHGFFNGMIDELRVSSLGNNPGLIGLQYLSENTPEAIFNSGVVPEQNKEGLVKMSNLEADVKSEYVSFRWTSEQEAGIDFYLLERSVGNDSFRTVQTCKAGNDIDNKQHYIILDKTPHEGTAEYRICYSGTMGKQVASLPIKVTFNPSGNVLSIQKVSPNPFRDKFAVTFNTSGMDAVQVSLTSISGELVHHTAFIPEQTGEQVFNFNGSESLSPGIYFLNLKQSDHQRTLKLVKRS